MSERRLRNIFSAGTLFFLLILIGMTIDSLPTQAEVNERITPLLAGRPSPEPYETGELAEAAAESRGK